MEGNFYISDKVISLPGSRGHSRYAAAYQQCPNQARAYGTCVEAAQVNRNLDQNTCLRERRELRRCVDAILKKGFAPARVGKAD